MSVDIGALSGRIEFEDKVTSTMEIISQKITALENKFGGLDHTVQETAAGFFIAETAMKAFEKIIDLSIDVIKDFTTEGAGIADVEENFNRLTEGAGRLGSTLLNELRAGTHNTITDFELMKSANDALAAGVQITDEQYRELATGAFALAQAKGIEVKEAFDLINDAMITGQTRSLKQLDIRIDQAAAEDAYAASLNTTADMLTTEGKQEASRAAILEKVTEATKRLGEQTDGLDEMVAQAQVAFKNFYEELIKTAATSPNVIKAFETVRDTLITAFGGDSQALLETFIGWINNLADAVTEYTPTVVSALMSIRDWVVDFYHGAVDAWSTYGPVIIGGLTTLKDWILAVYDQVVSTWNALPDWLKQVAEKAAVSSVAIVLMGQATQAASAGIEDIIGTAGNLTTTLSGIPAAIGNVAGAFNSAIGSIRTWWAVLDFSSFAQLRASLSLVTGELWAMVAPMAPLAIAIGGVTAAWMAWDAATKESGWVRELSDSFEYAALRIQGYSAAESDAMIATDHMTQKALEQEKAQQENAKAAEKVKSITDQMKGAIDAARDSTEAGTRSTAAANSELERGSLVMSKSKEEAKKYAEAWEQINAVTGTSTEILGQLDGVIVEAVKFYREAGIAMNQLKVAFELTDAQANAIEESFKKDNEALKEQAKHAKDVADAWKSLNELGKEQSQLLAGIGDRVMDDVFRYSQLGASVKDLALAYGLTEKQIGSIIDVREKEAKATEIQNTAYEKQNELLDSTHQMVKTLSGEYITLAEAKARQDTGGSMEITRGTLGPTAKYFGIPEQLAFELAKKGFSFQEIVEAYRTNQVAEWVPRGPRIAGFREGGIGDFGEGTLAMLHGKEAIIPLDSPSAPSFGPAPNIVIHVNGTAADVARKVSEEIMRTLKTHRQFGAA